MGRKLFVGIDPGTKGAIAIMDRDGKVIAVIHMPIFVVKKSGKRQTKRNPTGKGQGEKSHEDIQGIINFLCDHINADDDVIYCVEELLPVPKFGLATSVSMVSGMKLLVGIGAGMGFRINLIKAKAWQEIVFPQKRGPADKQRSIMFAKEMYPEWSRLMDEEGGDGIAEACLIAEASRRIFLGKSTSIA